MNQSSLYYFSKDDPVPLIKNGEYWLKSQREALKL
ncbi:hypothetical protein SAMN05192546_107111 [Tindallia californiensis]|uniref:Uncharacterized protein n=1 Tax=Tindallia californiensis TaxID=159292 RepID=A0A1H3PU77_9FIRM|nr:hypothetical protein SAMN05192546_107111 [Tindallia californiensis]